MDARVHAESRAHWCPAAPVNTVLQHVIHPHTQRQLRPDRRPTSVHNTHIYTNQHTHTNLKGWEQVKRWKIEKLQKKWWWTERKSEEGELWATDARRQTDKKRGWVLCLSGLIKGPPLQRESWCVCVCVCVCGQGEGVSHWQTESKFPCNYQLTHIASSSSSSSRPSSPERPKLLYPSTTHSGLNKAAPRLLTHTHTFCAAGLNLHSFLR